MKLYDSSLYFMEDGKKLTVLSLSIPLFFQQVFQYLLNTINSAMLSDSSDAAVAAVSISNQVMMVVNTITGILAFGAVIIMSLYLGSGDTKSAGSIAGTTVISLVVSSVLFSCIMAPCSGGILTLMDVDQDAFGFAKEYLTIKTALLPISALSTCMSSLLTCSGYALYSFIFGVARSILNVCFTYIALNIELPFSDVTGVAFAQMLAITICLILESVVYFYKKCPFSLSFNFSFLKRICKYGIPGKMSNFSYTFAQVVTTTFVVSMGTQIVSAKAYIANIVAYAPLVSHAVAGAGRILIGRFRGSGNNTSINKLHWQNIRISCAANLFCALAILCFYRPLIGIFTDDPAVLRLARDVMVVDIFVEVFRAINTVTEQSLNACGDVKTTFFASAISCWMSSALLSYVFGIVLNMGLVGIWLAFSIDEFVRAIFYLFYWRHHIRRSSKQDRVAKRTLEAQVQ